MGVHHIMLRPAVQVKGVVFLNGISSGPPSRVSPVVRAPWGGGDILSGSASPHDEPQSASEATGFINGVVGDPPARGSLSVRAPWGGLSGSASPHVVAWNASETFCFSKLGFG